MSGSLGLQQGTLRLAPWNPEWPRLYDQTVDQILGADTTPPETRFHHIGSTSVPGLAAKPILDIGIELSTDRQPDLARALQTLGYLDRGERSGWLFIRLIGGDVRTHNLHVYPPGDTRLARQIAFRDRLRSDPVARAAYQALKQNLLGLSRADYTDGKRDFVEARSQN